MERVGTLLQKLQEQFEQQAGAAQLLLTLRQLQAELLHLQQQGQTVQSASKVAIDMPPLPVMSQPSEAMMAEPVAEPVPMPIAEPIEPPLAETAAIAAEATPPIIEPPAPDTTEEKIVEVLLVDEADVEAELEEIKRNAAAKNNMSVHYKPLVLPDEELEIPEIPTLLHQPHQPTPAKELNEVIAGADAPSVNDKLKQRTTELADQLAEPPVKDLRKAIGINDKYLYINELFRGDETMYERSIKTINSFTILPEAEYWIQRELKVKLGWSEANPTVKQFNQLIKRRFS
jgi:hypothetical protein